MDVELSMPGANTFMAGISLFGSLPIHTCRGKWFAMSAPSL